MWGWKASTTVLSQQGGEAGRSLIRETPGRVASSSDNAGTCQDYRMVRVRQARREGVREKRAPRGADGSDGGERPPSPGRRSGGVKLEAARSGGHRGGREQPRQSRVGLALPDESGAVSETERYTRGTGVVTPLDRIPARTRWIWAGLRRVPARHGGRGTPDRVCFAWVGRPR